MNEYYFVFVKFHEQILYGIRYSKFIYEQILFGIWYSENFHEQIQGDSQKSAL